MNKYQEYQTALDYITSDVFTGGNSILETEAECIKNMLQELVDKTKTPTPEEVKKEWEALGYKFKVDHFPDAIIIRGFSYDKSDNIIYLFLKHREMSYGEYSRFSVQEHQLLTKTFRALGWEV